MPETTNNDRSPWAIRQRHVSRAVERLIAAGMELRFSRDDGHTHYLAWPGRSQTLRVSNHRNRRKPSVHVCVRLTFGHETAAISDERLNTMIDNALTQYLIREDRHHNQTS